MKGMYWDWESNKEPLLMGSPRGRDVVPMAREVRQTHMRFLFIQDMIDQGKGAPFIPWPTIKCTLWKGPFDLKCWR